MLMTNSGKQGSDVELGGEQGKGTKERVGLATKSNDPFQLGAYSNKILTRKGRFRRGRRGAGSLGPGCSNVPILQTLFAGRWLDLIRRTRVRPAKEASLENIFEYSLSSAICLRYFLSSCNG
jgi:hypothetical protein